jgi:hypothetical protein
LQFALNYLARVHVLAGELAAAALMIEEDRVIAEATGNPPVRYRNHAPGVAGQAGAGV